MRQRHILLLFALWLLVTPSAARIQPPPASADEIAQAIADEVAATDIPGASMAVIVGDRVVTRAVGVADARTGEAMTPATMLHIGSLTKVLTALAVVSTLEAKNVPLTMRVGRHMTGLTPRAADATFHALLSHTAGLRDEASGGATGDEAALAAAARAIGDADFLLPQGTVFSYSNLGYTLAGAALSEMANRPFADAVREQVLEPLGMRASAFRISDLKGRPRAAAHRASPPGPPPPLPETPTDTRGWPAGYLWSNADDMSLLLRALVSQGTGRTRPPLSPRAVVAVSTGHAAMPNVFVGGHYGYGLMIASDSGVRFFEHGGTMTGYSAILRIVPDRGVAFAILSNLDGAPLRRIAATVMARALRLQATPPPRTESAVLLEELRPFAGLYRNRSTAEVAIRGGQAVLVLDGSSPMALTRLGADRYLARPRPGVAGPEIVLRPASGAAPAYLHFGLWAHVKVDR
jgi:CubicO group peptidase (beta-lactamase class C family)